MVPNPPYHAGGDFALAGDASRSTAEPRLTFGNIGVYDTALFRELPRGVKLKMLPLYRAWIAAGIVARRALRRAVGERRHAGRSRGARRARSTRSASPEPRAPIHRRRYAMNDNPAARLLRPAALRSHPRRARRARHRRAARRRARTPSSASRSDTRPGDVGQRSSRRPRAAFDHLDRAWGAVRASERGRQHAGDPRRLQRRAAEGHRVLRRHRAGPRAGSRAFARSPRRRRSRRSTPRGARSSTTRCAISGWAAPSSPATDKARFKAVQEELATLSAKFDDNVLDSENAWAHYVDDAAGLAGVPGRRRRRGARRGAQADGRAGYKLTLRYPCYMPVMQYADDRVAARDAASRIGNARVRPRRIARMGQHARSSRASSSCGARRRSCSATRTSPSCRSCRRWRSTPAEVLAFLRDLAQRARPFAEREYAELVAFARDELGIAGLSRRGTSPTSPKS